jgi:hypothetical protein
MIKPVWLVEFTGHRSTEQSGRSTAEIEACRPRIRMVLEMLSLKAELVGGSCIFSAALPRSRIW